MSLSLVWIVCDTCMGCNDVLMCVIQPVGHLYFALHCQNVDDKFKACVPGYQQRHYCSLAAAHIRLCWWRRQPDNPFSTAVLRVPLPTYHHPYTDGWQPCCCCYCRIMMQVAAILDERGTHLDTTAEQRPNAYIPEQLGIPKPYGAFAPFKPSAAGTTMRHIKKPQPKEVVI